MLPSKSAVTSEISACFSSATRSQNYYVLGIGFRKNFTCLLRLKEMNAINYLKIKKKEDKNSATLDQQQIITLNRFLYTKLVILHCARVLYTTKEEATTSFSDIDVHGQS